jgi:DNA-binding NarL/FixJ family response regulator
VRLVVVDDHAAVADAIAARLRCEPDVEIVASTTDPESAFAAIDALQPNVVIVDADLGRHDGLALVRRIREADPRVAAVTITGHDDEGVAAAAVQAGALAFVLKDEPTNDLVDAVHCVAAGGARLPAHLLAGVLESLRRPDEPRDARLARLTERERQVLALVVAGHDRATISRELYLSLNTLRTHLKNIFAKLEVHSTIEAVHVAVSGGLRPVRPPSQR